MCFEDQDIDVKEMTEEELASEEKKDNTTEKLLSADKGAFINS